LTRLLLLPLLPVLSWGPATHPLINARALERAKAELQKNNPRINPEIVTRLSRQREAYVYGGNSADVIAVYHLGSGGSAIYDYAHNYYPDHAGGIPLFGYSLIDEWQEAITRRGEAAYSEKDFAIACGWLSHQLADWYAHYAAVDRDGSLCSDPTLTPDARTVFPGYANSHRILGAYFPAEILALYNEVDHALVELAHDMLILRQKKEIWRRNRVELFETYHHNGHPGNLLTDTSERYRGVAARIPPEHIERLKNEFNLVIRGLRLFTGQMCSLNPGLLEMLHNSLDPAITGKPDFLQLSVEKIVDELFCQSFAEIARLARQSFCTPVPGAPTITMRDPGRTGTILFGFLRWVGELIGDPDQWRYLWGAVDLKTLLFKHLVRCLGTRRLWRFGNRLHPDPALWGFVSELFAHRHPNLEGPRSAFRRKLQPVVGFDGPAGLSEAELVRWMVGQGELRVKVVPGLALDDPAPEKKLDPESVRFLINNYPVQELPAFYRLQSAWEGEKLLLRCAIKSYLCAGYHLLHVGAADRSGCVARVLEREIHFARLKSVYGQCARDGRDAKDFSAVNRIQMNGKEYAQQGGVGLKPRVGVLMGGLSAEREVSLRSGRAVCQALESKGYQVVPIVVDRNLPRQLQESGIDLAFIALHGPFGEDGTVQGMLELLGIPYTGSGVLASALAMDKIATKKILTADGLPTPAYRAFEVDDPVAAAEALAALGLPLVVKPPAQGSSIGVCVVYQEDEFQTAVREAGAFGPRVLVEQFLEGPELTAAVLGNRKLVVLPLIEIVSATGRYDYEAKYTPGLSDHIIPPRVSPQVQEAVRDLAVRAYQALGCRGFARVDLIVSGNQPYILEINTIPGLTEVSLFPDAARAAGLEFPDLVEQLLQLARQE